MANERTPLSNSDTDNEVDYEDLLKSRRKPKRYWGVILLILLIGVGIFLGIYLTRDKSDDNNTPVSPAIWDQIRLPSYIRPTHYNLTISPNLMTSQFNGTVNVRLNITQSTNVILCHVLELEIEHVQIWNDDGQYVNISSYFFVPEHQFLVVQLNSYINGTSNIEIIFHAPLKSQLVGFYKSTYVADGINHTLATTKFEPTHARRAFPCWDEPAFKATYDIVLISHAYLTYLSNMPIDSRTLINNGTMERVTFQRSVPMSTYLVAFIVSDFQSLPSAHSSSKFKTNKTISVYTNVARLNQTILALDVASHVLGYYEDYFGIEYPLPKLDLVAIPDFQSGAMENWGCITFRETSLLYSETQSSAADKQAIILTIAHEISHQWFGNLVTMEWWDDLWLNEGFASYMEYLGGDAIFQNYSLSSQFVSSDLTNALTLDASINSHPIVVDVKDPNQINELFDSISYDKGASVIRMMSKFVGDKNFITGLTKYLTSHAYGNAKSADLWAAMTDATNGQIQVGQIMDTWTKQMGYPLLTLTRVDNTTAQVTGVLNRFVIGENTNPGNFAWYIPLFHATAHGDSSIQWFTPQDSAIIINVTSQDSWIKLNRNATTLYRTQYDIPTWNGLITALLSGDSILSVDDRAQLVSDVWTLAYQGSGSYPLALNLSLFLTHEMSYPVWSIALTQLRSISSLLSSTSISNKWIKYMNGIMNNITSYVGWNTTQDHQQALLQGLILKTAVSNNISDSRIRAQSIWNTTHSPDINPNIRDAVLAVAIQQDPTTWSITWNCYQSHPVVSVALKCLYAMAATQDITQISWLLNATIDGRIRSQDSLSVIRLISSNYGRTQAWNFVIQNWDILYQTYVVGGGRSFGPFIGNLLSDYSTMNDYIQKQKDLIGRNVGPGASSVQDGLNGIQQRAQWITKNQPIIETWLNQYGL